MDNCEHVIEAPATLIDALLAECPRLRVLVTSREPLGITGEPLCPVPPLATPPPGAAATEATKYAAIQLFTDRAAAVRPGFAVDDGNVAAVTAICARLDGVPVAIELAAPRARALSAGQIAERLDDRFRLLTGGSQTLRAVVDWSWDLLDAAERDLVGCLAVFPGGATLVDRRLGEVGPEEAIASMMRLAHERLIAEDVTGAVAEVARAKEFARSGCRPNGPPRSSWPRPTSLAGAESSRRRSPATPTGPRCLSAGSSPSCRTWPGRGLDTEGHRPPPVMLRAGSPSTGSPSRRSGGCATSRF